MIKGWRLIMSRAGAHAEDHGARGRSEPTISLLLLLLLLFIVLFIL